MTITYKDLCIQNQVFQRSQQAERNRLQNEVSELTATLAERLALKDKYYKANLSDETATALYVQSKINRYSTDNKDNQSVIFDLFVTLEESEDTYPKHTFGQLLELSYMQAERLKLTFLEYRTSVNINLGDSNEWKFKQVIDTYLELLMKRLAK